ncbi:MAG TPA: flagellar motor protein MotB [Bryobacteraceae bacterium]|nr:flagellar motor protein MotB [Bryobacteraceae bacterium]
MSAKKNAHPIIIVHKKIAHHDDEHGGAWKVAYADFVTAMMALFIVLWLLSASEKVQKAVGGYFQDPTGQGRQTGTTTSGIAETLSLNQNQLSQIKEKMQEAMRQIPSFKDIQNQVKMTITAEGLRIDLLETKRGMFFENGDPKPTEAGDQLLKVLATELMKLPNKIVIEGHTDATPFGRPDYSNWELSADRANAARRVLMASGLADDRISQVRGFADQRLLLKNDPTNPSNRRISIIVRNQGLDEHEEELADGTAPEIAAAKRAAAAKDAKAAPAAAKSEKPASAVMLPATGAKK